MSRFATKRTVSYCGHYSPSFRLTQGVKLDSIPSPHFNNNHTRDLLKGLNTLIVGTTINGVYTGVVAYTEEAILMMSTMHQLREAAKI